MKNYLPIFSVLLFLSFASAAQQKQRVLAECTVDYSVNTDDVEGIDNSIIETFKSTSKTVYIKGNQSRVDLKSTAFSQAVIYNKKSGDAVILREIGGNKFLTKLSNAAWTKSNSRYENAKLTLLDETKIILGYECKKAVLTLADSLNLNLYYTIGFTPSVNEFEYQFKNVPGFVLEYEAQDKSGIKVRYIATKINLNPVSASKFEIPTSGYRLLNE
jgi:GLPGLI family protein